jgi:hypothetical protein
MTQRFKSPVARLFIVLILMSVAVTGVAAAMSYVTTPWAHTAFGRTALVGYWQGQMLFEPGDTRQVALSLRKFRTLADIWLQRPSGAVGSTPVPDLGVAAKLCGTSGRMRYEGSGDVKNRDGSQFTFGLAPEGGVFGKHPSGFAGAWDGKDRLELTARLYTLGPEGATGVASASARPGASSDPGVISFELRRSTSEAFDAACPADSGGMP